MWKVVLAFARIIRVAHDDETCNQLSLSKWGKNSFASKTALFDRSTSTAPTFTYEEITLKNVIDRKGEQKVIVLSGPPLSEWPKMNQSTALAMLNKEIKADLEEMMRNNKPHKGEVSVINLEENQNGITKIVILPVDIKSTTTVELQNLYIDAVIKLTDSKEHAEQVYLFPPATRRDISIIANGQAVCSEMADTLGAAGKVTVVSKQGTNLFPSSAGGKGAPSVKKYGTQNSVSGGEKVSSGTRFGVEGNDNLDKNTTTNVPPVNKGNAPPVNKGNAPPVNEGNVPPVNNKVENPAIEQPNVVKITRTAEFTKSLKGGGNIPDITVSMHYHGMLGYAKEHFESTQRGKPYSVVNAANSLMSHGGGIAAVLKKKAGGTYENDCQILIAHRMTKEGVCITTGSYHLGEDQPNCQRIHNVVAPIKHQISRPKNAITLQDYREIFKNAWIELFESGSKNPKEEIVCCFIGCSIFGGSGEDMAQGLYSAMQDDRLKNLKRDGILPKLHLVGWTGSNPPDGLTLNQFEQKWASLMQQGNQQAQNTDQSNTGIPEETTIPKAAMGEKNKGDGVVRGQDIIIDNDTNNLYFPKNDDVANKSENMDILNGSDDTDAEKNRIPKDKIAAQQLPENSKKGTDESAETTDKGKFDSANEGAVGGGDNKESTAKDMIQLNVDSGYSTVDAAINAGKERLAKLGIQCSEAFTVVSAIPKSCGKGKEYVTHDLLATIDAGELCSYTLKGITHYLTISNIEKYAEGK
ncbi:MAG: macro domain-containing protein [Endozoicomonadaceae bacterium]|nr:macro domain-containing protein [Endozoicomonadaceae bacterium]